MQYEPKFEIGQKVYYLDEDLLFVKSGIVQSILIEKGKSGDFEYQYNMGDEYYVAEEAMCSVKSKEQAEFIFGLRSPFDD